GGKIGAGDVQWMTAGNGIVHEEFHSQDFTHKGGALQMVQLWVNLRAKDKSAKAGYQTPLKAQIPDVPLPQDAGAVRVTRRKFYRLQVPLPRYVRFFLFGLQKQDSGLPKLLGKSHPPAGRRRSRAEDSDSDQDTEAVVEKICRGRLERLARCSVGGRTISICGGWPAFRCRTGSLARTRQLGQVDDTRLDVLPGTAPPDGG